MGKKENYFILAEKYYVEEQLPVSTIAKRLNITDKTLHSWKKEGDWDEKRKDFLASKYNCFGALYELLGKVTQKAIAECGENGTVPDGAVLYFIGKMTDKLPKLKNLESVEIVERLAENSDKKVNINVINEVDKFLRGEVDD